MEQQLQNLTMGKAVMAGVVLTVLYFFLFYNDGSVMQTNISTGNGEIQTKEAELEKIKKAVADAERYQNTKRALGAELDSVLKAIPAQLTSQDLMKIVSTEAKAMGINLNINPASFSGQASPEDKSVFFEPVVVSLSLDGTYNQLMSFLSAITKVDKIITLSSLTLVNSTSGRAPEDSGPVNLKLTAEMRAYRYLPQSAPKEAN